MEFKLDKRYPLPVPVDAAWRVLSDVRATAACLPGAAITEQLDARRYQGVMKAKVGPATMNFAGAVEVLELDEATRTMRMLGKGADKAGSSASMQLAARLEPGDSADASVLVGEATVVVSGKLAQFGSRLLVPVSDALLAQFVGNFAATAGSPGVGREPTPSATPAPATETETETGLPASVPDAADAAPTAGAPPESPFATSPERVVPASDALASPPPPPSTAAIAPARELNALALLWSVFRHWLSGLFGPRR